ncbi:MAG: thioredoxin domain-containing protein [Actinomycetota bacterium]
MANRLSGETSPYLLQHKDNPVDWYPWGDEAFEVARSEDKPVLLSIGYAACHWCHVMERESFEDIETARLMNEGFVSIKVDREERPDVDNIYMDAVQAMTGHGGWPMTMFLTPDGDPFFGGTYFPDVDRHGMPSFKKILAGVLEAWRERRAGSSSPTSVNRVHSVVGVISMPASSTAPSSRSRRSSILSTAVSVAPRSSPRRWSSISS